MMAEAAAHGPSVGHHARSAPRVELPCVDGARAVAAFAVVAYHAAGYAYYSYGTHWAPRPVRSVMSVLGQLGVAMFFVLSGFLLHRPFASAHLSGVTPPRLLPFWARRIARILPGYWVALTGAILLGTAWFADGAPLRDRLIAYGLVQNYWFGGQYAFGLGVAWTLVIEVSFYAALPCIALGLRGIARTGRMTAVRAQVLGLLGLVAVGVASRTVWLFVIHKDAPSAHAWFPIGQLGYWLPCYLDWFAVGMLLAVASVWREGGGRVPRPLRALADRAVATWGLAALAILALTRTGLPVIVFRPFGAVTEWWWDAWSVLAAALLVLPVLLPGRRADRGRRLLAARPMVLLGAISYGIYLWNLIAYRYLAWHRSAWWSPDGLWAYLAIAVAVTVGVAYLSFVLVERPVLEVVHRAVGTTRRVDGPGWRPTWRVPVGAERARVADWVDEEAPLSRRYVFGVYMASAGALAMGAWMLPALRAAMA